MRCGGVNFDNKKKPRRRGRQPRLSIAERKQPCSNIVAETTLSEIVLTCLLSLWLGCHCAMQNRLSRNFAAPVSWPMLRCHGKVSVQKGGSTQFQSLTAR